MASGVQTSFRIFFFSLKHEGILSVYYGRRRDERRGEAYQGEEGIREEVRKREKKKFGQWKDRTGGGGR